MGRVTCEPGAAARRRLRSYNAFYACGARFYALRARKSVAGVFLFMVLRIIYRRAKADISKRLLYGLLYIIILCAIIAIRL